jgi:Dolichyl-phosphate-mannose-protein mannosyltransferase
VTLIAIAKRSVDRIHLGALTAVWIVMAAVAGVVGDFPLNDDWIYGGATRSILVDGTFRIPGPTIANVFAQAYWGLLFCLPFGFSYTALRISTLVLGLIGLWALYGLVRENGGSSRVALVGSISLAVYPLFFGPASSFMTDVPFIATALVAMFFLMRSIRTGSAIAFLLGTLACLATVLIRQVGLAVPLAFMIIHAVRYRGRLLMMATGVLPVLISAAGHVIYQRWLISSGRGPEVFFSGLTDLIPAAPIGFLINAGRFTIFALPYIGVATLPVALATRLAVPDGMSPRLWRMICRIAGLAGLGVFAGLWWKGDRLPVLGNVLMEWGLGPLTQRDTYLLQINLPETGALVASAWIVATALGVAGGVVLLLRMVAEGCNWVQRLRRSEPATANWAGGFVLLVAGIYWGIMLILLNRYGYFFDRYVLPMVAFGLVLLCLDEGNQARDQPRWRAVAAWAMIGCTGLLSVGLTHDYLAWNRARWTALTALTGSGGVSPRQIDGGYEFNGLMLYDPHHAKSLDKSYWWVVDDEYILASGPLPGYREVGRQPVDSWLPISVSSVITLRRF